MHTLDLTPAHSVMHSLFLAFLVLSSLFLAFLVLLPSSEKVGQQREHKESPEGAPTSRFTTDNMGSSPSLQWRQECVREREEADSNVLCPSHRR